MMRFFTRTIVFALCLFTFLGYLSYRLYSPPSQIKARMEQYLSRFVSREVRVEGCEEPFLNVLSVRSISVPSSPSLDERTLLVLEDLRVDDPSPRRGFRKFLKKPVEDIEASPLFLRARNAVLDIDRKVEGPPGAETLRWNFDDLLRPEAILGELHAARAQILLDRLQVQLQALRPPEPKLSWRVGVRDAEIRPSSPAGVSLEGDLLEGEYWSGGQFQSTWAPGTPFHLRAEIEDLRSPERWLPLLKKDYRELWERFRPEGSVNLDIVDAEWTPGGLNLKATVRHYDTTVLLGDSDLMLEHLRGSLALNESEVTLGSDAREGEAGADAAMAELWGTSVKVTGKFGQKGGEIRLRLPLFPVENLAIFGSEKVENSLASFLRFVRPAGGAEGELVVNFKPGEKEELKGDLGLRDISSARFPLLSKITGSLDIESIEEKEGAAPSKTSSRRVWRGKLGMKADRFAGLEAGQGHVLFNLDGERVRLQFTNIQLGDDLADSGRIRGSIIGSLEWGPGENGNAVHWDLRWLGLTIATGLFRATDGSGASKSLAGKKEAPGSMTVSKAVVPAGVLWPSSEELRFESGKCRFLLGTNRLWVKSFKLLGEKESLRAQGGIDFSGELDLVVLLNQGPSYVALYDLADESRPFEWKQAARGSFRAFRLTGSLATPRSREIGALDPAFVGGQ